MNAYIRFSHDADAVHHYVLDLPTIVVDPQADAAGELYPQPDLWYLATHKTWVRRYTDTEYDDYWGAGAGTMTGDATDAAMDAAAAGSMENTAQAADT